MPRPTGARWARRSWTGPSQGWLNEQTRGLLEEQAASIKTDPLTVLLLATTLYYSAQWTDEFNEEAQLHRRLSRPVGRRERRVHVCREVHGLLQRRGLGRRCGSVSGAGTACGSSSPTRGVSADALLEDAEVMRLMSAGEADGASMRGYTSPCRSSTSPLSSSSSTAEGAGRDGCFRQRSLGLHADDGGRRRDMRHHATHAARVKIDEDGVEAAAFTVLEPGDTAPMPPELEIHFTLDRPFLFSVVTGDGLPLFAGIVNTP